MFRRSGFGHSLRKLLPGLLITLSGGVVQAATIGQWIGNPSNQNWAANSSNFSSIYAAATAASQHHTVESAEQITSANLGNDNFFIIANAAAAPTSAEIATLANWVKAGHILLLFNTPGGGSIAATNAILSGIGSSIQMNNTLIGLGGSNQAGAGTLSSSDPSVAGPPQNINGASLALFQTYSLTGGTRLALDTPQYPIYNLGNSLRVDTVQLGKVYVFGERFDSNPNLNSGIQGTSNLGLFIGLLAQQTALNSGGGSDVTGNPEPATLAITGLALIGLVAWKRRRSNR